MKKMVLLLLVLALSACAPVAIPETAVTPETPAVEQVSTPEGEEAAATAPAEEPAAESTEPTAGAQGQTAAEGGTITRAITAEPPSLDPGGVAGASQNAILPYLFDTLVYRDVDNTFKPYLAEEWTVSEDGKTVTFRLRPGVTFHDGTPFNAEAVAYTFNRVMVEGSQSPLSSSLANVETIEAAAEDTVVFHLKQPSSTLLSTLSTAYAGIVSPTAAETAGDAFGMNPVGSGPFEVGSWQPGESVTLVRNEAYAWGPPVLQNPAAPHLESLVFKIIPDASSQLTAFQAGEVDVLFVNQPSQIARLKDDPNAHLEETTLNSLIYLGFNVRAEPFDDVRVRRAIAHAIDKAQLVELGLGGIGEAAFSPLASTLPGFDPSLKSLEPTYDLTQTETLLQEAGFTRQDDGTWTGENGEPLALELLTSTRPPNETLAALLQDQLMRAGIPVEIRALESAAVIEAATNGEYQMMLSRYDWNDADVLNVYLSSARLGRTNRTFYSNPELDAILEQAQAEQDADARAVLYSEAQRILIEDQPWVPLYVPKDYIVTRSSIQDPVFGVMGRMLLNDAWIQP